MIYNYTLHFGAFSRNVDPEDEELVLHSAQDFANAISKMLSRQDTKVSPKYRLSSPGFAKLTSHIHRARSNSQF